MRTLVVVLAVFLAVWLGFGAILAGEAADARIRARVREVTDPAVSDLRRDLVVLELSRADAAATARVVREALLSDARRAAAADLAARLRLPGVFDLAKRRAEGPAEAAILRLALAAPEPAAAEWIAERWRTSDPAGERFRAADDALRRERAAQAVVERIAPALDDAVRGTPALAILREQMAVDDASPEALLARWPAAWERYRFEAREFPRGGADLLPLPGWRLAKARRVGRNLRVPASSSVELDPLPIVAQTEDGTVRVRIAPGAGAGAFVGLRTSAAAQELRLSCDGRCWFLVEGPPREGTRVEAPFRAAEWADVEFRISDPALRDRPSVRDVRVLVDRAELRPSGGFWRLSSPPASLVVAAARGREGDPATCVGGIEWRSGR